MQVLAGMESSDGLEDGAVVMMDGEQIGVADSEDMADSTIMIQVTPDQESALEEFFHINNWHLVKG